MGEVLKKVRNHFRGVIRIKKSPHSMALGFAIGTLIEILPTPGINIILALIVILAYPKVSKLALFGALLFWNPLFTIPLYALSFRIGSALFGNAPVVKYNVVVLDNIYNFSRRFLVGNTILAVSISAISYVVVRITASYVQKRKHAQGKHLKPSTREHRRMDR